MGPEPWWATHHEEVFWLVCWSQFVRSFEVSRRNLSFRCCRIRIEMYFVCGVLLESRLIKPNQKTKTTHMESFVPKYTTHHLAECHDLQNPPPWMSNQSTTSISHLLLHKASDLGLNGVGLMAIGRYLWYHLVAPNPGQNHYQISSMVSEFARWDFFFRWISQAWIVCFSKVAQNVFRPSNYMF